MTCLPKFPKYVLSLLVFALIAGLVSCAHGNGGTAPATAPELTAEMSMPDSPSGDGVTLGYFQLVFDDDGTVRVEEAAPIRGADFNVTAFASFVIEDFHFNEEMRNWYITATIKNISPYTGYDVWAVFHSLGNKFLANQDGFLWALPPIFPEPTRCAFIAYAKDQPDRVFPPMFQATRTIVIHQPEGIPKLAPLGFWIDATINPRKAPGVEDLEVTPLDDSPDNTEYHLTGFIWDHQSPSEDLTAWADCSSFNGNNYEQLFDDGNHSDGEAADNIFGGFFSGDPEEGVYTITVYAFDPQGNQGENDARFWHGEGPCDKPLEFYPFQTIEIGEHSGIQWLEEVVINDMETWVQVWTQHKSNMIPPPPPPPINFEMHTVIGVWTGDHPTNNHIAEIKDVYYDPCEDLVTVHYNYTPYIGCGPLDVITDPFHIIVLPKFEHPAYFVGHEVECPGPPPECVEPIPIETIAHGVHSGIHEPYELRIGNQEDFMLLWQQHTANMWPPPQPPEIDWSIHDLAAVAIGERPTGGFECNIYELCWLEDGGMGLFYVERIPGPDCNVPQVFTQPHHWVLVPKVDSPLHFFSHSEVYNCGTPDCEQPLMFWPIDQGPHTGHPAGNFVIKNPDEFHEFWTLHKPDQPIPPVQWEEEMVFAMLIGGRPSTGYFVETKEVCLNGLNDPDQSPHIDVTFVENIPGPDCKVMWIATKPFQIIVVPRHDVPVFFNHEEFVYDCQPCEEVPWYELAEDEHSCAEPGVYGFQGFGQGFEDLWYNLHCFDPDSGDPPPEVPKIPDPTNPGWEMKPFVIQLHEVPTSGYSLTIDNVCLDGCTAIVDYTLWIPGPDCNVDQIVTKPWVFGVAEFPPIDCEINWEFNGHEEVYECGDCSPRPFYQIADGHKSCAEPGEYGWQHEEGYINFWHQVNCYDPPPLPEEPPPSGDNIMYHFGIQVPERPSTGYFITIDEVCIEGCDVFIEWTEHIPGDNCNVEWIETKPWAIGAVEMPPVYCYWQWHFEKHEVVYDCPDEDCWEFDTIAGSNVWGGAEPGGWYFDNMYDYHVYWNTYHPDENMPPINFEGGWGGYAVHLGQRPTTGFEVEVFEICKSDDPFGAAVRWVEWIPGETCPVIPDETAPWTLVTFPLVDLPYFDEGFEEIYQCE